MSSSRSLISYDRDPSAEEEELLLKTAIRMSQRFTYRKLKKDQYECTCCRCDRSAVLTKHQLDMVREAKLCLWCAEAVKASPERENKALKTEWIDIGTEPNISEGYEVTWWIKNREIQHRIRHVAHFDYSVRGEMPVTHVKGIVKNFGSLISSNHYDYWRKVRRSSMNYYGIGYDSYFESAQLWDVSAKQSSKRQFYENYADDMPPLKSNQVKFIRDGIYNMKQIAAIHMFDLNTPEQVHQFKKLIRNNTFREPKALPVLNPSYADYLQRNDYSISQFMDYFDMCRELGQKVEKPKNLHEAHQRQIDQKKAIEMEKHRKAVASRHADLQKHDYEKGTLEVKAFENIEKVQQVANELHNCIARIYLGRYCDNTLDLFYGTKNGKINFAIEVLKGSIVQLRGVNNKRVSDDVEKFVKKWAKKEGFAYEV